MSRLQYIIDFLPATSRDIALYFRSRGIKGIRKDHNYCPIVNYLRAETGEEYCSVGGSGIILGHATTKEHIRAPNHILEFIRAFDSGYYDSIIFSPTQE